MNLKIRQLTKIYGNGVRALDDLSIDINKGMFGLLGPNGAGKSTLMRTIATLQSADNGSISFQGINVLENPMMLRRILGYLPQEFGVYPKTSAENLLDYFARLKGIHSRKDRQAMIVEALHLTNLYDVRKEYVDGYSGGMKQRFGIAHLLLNNPQLIIVDEPTAGLDPAERQRFLNVLREIGNESVVIFSTHIVDDIRELCHDMAIINQGKLLQHTTPDKAIETLQGKVWTHTISRNEYEHYEKKYTLLSAGYNPDNTMSIRTYASGKPAAPFLQAAPQLEDVYFAALKQL